jgi:hypothetical protein
MGEGLCRAASPRSGFMRDGGWHSLADIAEYTKDPEASVSARLRDLRKPRFGSYIVQRKNFGGGVWKYRLLVGQLELACESVGQTTGLAGN